MKAYPKIIVKNPGTPLKQPKHKKVLFIRPFCYYCNRDFPSEKVLISHQKAVHFRCNHQRCRKFFNEAAALQEHTEKVHRRSITKINRALTSRSDPNVSISGMAGVSLDIIMEKRDAIQLKYPNRLVKIPPFMLVLASSTN